MLKQIFLINTDLNMRKGKIAVQVAHGTVMYMLDIIHKNDIDMCRKFKEWRQKTSYDPIGIMKKVVLKSTEAEIREYLTILKQLNIWSYSIYDKGLTQVPENSLTCIIVEPLEESQCNALFGNLKLL